MKKLLKLGLCLLLSLPLVACQSKKGSEEFAEFTKTLPNLLCRYNSLDINFLFNDPEAYGIEKDLYTMDYMSLEDYLAYSDELDDVIDQVDDYDYDALTTDQKITYDLLKADDPIEIDDEASYYLNTNYFDIQSGIQSQLPMALWNYEFKNQKSLDSFLAILNQAPTMFKKYTDLEVVRQEKGYGMSQPIMDKVLSSIHTIVTTDQSYIVDAAYTKLDQVEFIDADKKQAYKDDIKKAFNESFIPAFAQAEKDLSAVEIKTQGDGALASYVGGKDQYANIVLNATGLDSMDEYTKLLDNAEKNIQSSLMDFMKKYPEIISLISNNDQLSEALENIQYTQLTSSNDVIAYLEEKVAASDNFPSIKKLEYQMNTFPEAMKDTTTAAAAYFLSAFDDTSGTGEQMILNGTFDQQNFTTIAHESFPGHMYQNNYFKTVEHDILRSILANSGYSEGWATFVEDQVCDFSDDPALCHMMSINSQLTYIYVLRLDKAIHYDGITREEAYQELRDNFGVTDDVAKTQYEQLLQMPGAFSDYYASLYRIQEIQKEAKTAWKDDYSDGKFNEAILNLGPLPFDLLEKYLELNTKN